MNLNRTGKKYSGDIIDMHCHVLPGVDDGANSFDQSLNMLRISASEGVSSVVATPHLIFDGSDKLYLARIRETYAELKTKVLECGIPIRLTLGFELLLSASLLHAENIGEYSIEGTNRLLVEPQNDECIDLLDELLHELGHKGMSIVLAHPERCGLLAKNTGYIRMLVGKGVLVQANAGSITGEWGRGAQVAAKRMSGQGLVHLIGSDGHSDSERKPEINAAVAALRDWTSEKTAADIAYRTAYSLLNPFCVGVGMNR